MTLLGKPLVEGDSSQSRASSFTGHVFTYVYICLQAYVPGAHTVHIYVPEWTLSILRASQAPKTLVNGHQPGPWGSSKASSA